LRRLRPHFLLAAALLAGVLLEAQGSPPAAPLVLLSREGRRPIPTIIQSGQELIALDDVAALFQVTVREDALTGGVTISYKGRTIVASTDQPMVSVEGRVVALPAPAVRAGRRWLVPVEFISRALAPIYDSRIDLRKPSRLLIVGDLRVPRVNARIESAGPPTRVVIDVTPPGELTMSQEPPRVLVRIGGDALDARLPVAGQGLVDQIRQGDQPTTIAVMLRGGTTAIASSSVSETGTRVIIDVSTQGPTTVPSPSPTPAPLPSTEPAPTPPTSRPTIALIAIDPGHGGDDRGVAGAGGVLEKDVTLDVARRVKALIEARLGIRVLLTRDDDRRLTVDERASVANNNKADLFISLHANAAFAPAVSGAEVFYLALDPELEEARRAAQAESVALPVLGGGTRVIDVVRWDMAQARHLDDSRALAEQIEAELRSRVPVGAKSLQRAPLRVLVGANMPAVLVEMAYLTNEGQAKRAVSAEFQTAVAQAIYEAVLRFRARLEATP
jgi:N-acetylmuramoyl-L-alanine amidase